MNIFNSLGSNYDFNFAVKSLFAFGGNAKDLEKFLEERYGGKALLVYKGREAIELALKSLNLPADSYVAINGFTCFAVYEAITSSGLGVEYLDIERGELNFSAEELEKHLTQNSKIKAVIIQNTLGYPCEVEQIAKICQGKKIILIEDLAHSVGTRYKNGQRSGTIGDMTILSFSQDKMIDGISGGALINNGVKLTHPQGVQNRHPGTVIQLIDRFYPFFTYLIRATYPILIGKILHQFFKSFKLLSGPMDKLDNELHHLPNWYCHLIKIAFDYLPENLAHRKKIASIYAEFISPRIVSPKITSAINLSTNLRFPIFVNNRESLIKYLKNHGVYISDIWYDAPIAPKKYLSLTNYQNECPNAELAASEILNLPTHRNVSEKMAEKISNLINQWLKLQ